jgi:hypothetical protein
LELKFHITEKAMKSTAPLSSSRSPKLCLLFSLGFALAAFAPRARATAPVVGLWRFNEGSGTNTTDSSGFSNNGFLAGENGNTPAWVPGQPGFGHALYFTNDGLDHAYVSVPGATSLKIGQTTNDAWTITAWAYENSEGTGGFFATYGRILVIDDGDAFQLESGGDGDGQLYTWSRENPGWQIGWGVGSPVTPLLDQWEHWAVVYDGTNLTVYLNGNQGPVGGVASNPVSAAIGYARYQGSILIGSELAQDGTRNWNGMLDDVALFAGALSQSEIQTVMSGDFSAHLAGGPAQILAGPQPATVVEGANASFNVEAQGQAPVFFQWYFDATNRLAGATNATLLLTNVQFSQAGAYSVVVTNSLGGQTSPAVSLTVHSPAPALVGLWRFNEGSGTNTADSSGLNNNGALMGENGNLPAWVPGQPGFGSALYFTNDGADHVYVSVSGTNSLMIGQTPGDTWSITAWAYEDSDGTGDFFATYGRVLVIDDGNAFQFESGASGDGQLYTWSQATTAWQIGWGSSSPVAPLLDQWEHWAVVYDGSTLSIYRNGNQGANAGFASAPVSAALGYAGYAGSIIIGSELDQNADRNWNGMLDDIAVFTGALTQEQIDTIMTGDFSGFVSAPPRLSAAIANGNATLSWPSSATGFHLQSVASLPAPAWTNVTNTPVPMGGSLTVTLPADAGTQFFRLTSP